MTEETREDLAKAHLAYLRGLTPAGRVEHLRAIRLAWISETDRWGRVAWTLTDLIDRVKRAAGL